MSVLEIKTMQELDEKIKNTGRKLLVITFSSQNCGPCRPIPACLKALSEEMPDIVFVKVEVGKCDEYTVRFEINGVPAFHFYRHGCYLEHFEGGNTGHLKKVIDRLRFQ